MRVPGWLPSPAGAAVVPAPLPVPHVATYREGGGPVVRPLPAGVPIGAVAQGGGAVRAVRGVDSEGAGTVELHLEMHDAYGVALLDWATISTLLAVITAPAHQSTHAAALPIVLRGEAVRLGDATPIDAVLSWRSSRDGAIGTGAELSAMLSVGTHLIELTATAGEESASDSIVITVTDEPVIVIPLNQWRVSDWRSAAFRWPP